MMAIVLPCKCGKQLRVKEELAGKKIRCPGCQTILAVPADDSETPEPKAVRTAKSAPAAARPAPVVRSRPRPTPSADSDASFDRLAPPRQLALRIIALVVGILGSLAACLLALGAYAAANNPTERTAAEYARRLIAELEKANPSAPQLHELRSELARFERLSLLGHVGLAACLLGITGALLGFFRLGKIAAPLLLVPAIGAAIVAVKSLIFTALLIVAGILCTFIKSKPRAEAIS